MTTRTKSKAVKSGGTLNLFEKYLTIWVFVCIVVGIFLGRMFPGVAQTLDAMSIYNVSIPIDICLFFMMYPMLFIYAPLGNCEPEKATLPDPHCIDSLQYK